MTLYMARMRINKPAFHQWSRERRHQDLYLALHRLVSSTFGPRTLRTFRLTTPADTRSSTLYAYTQLDQAHLKEAAQTVAEPMLLQVINTEEILTKPMPETWREGQELGFNLRTRPIHRISRGYNQGDTERDPYRRSDKTRPRFEIYAEWLANLLRNSGAVQLQRVFVTSFEENNALREEHLSRVPLTGVCILF